MDFDSDNESGVYSLASASGDPHSVSSVSSYDADRSMRPRSPVSVMSIDSTMQLLRHEYGRDLNNYSEVYNLPADEEELKRLNIQHAVLVEIFGKYPTAMAEVLAEEDGPGETKSCLDLGCGAGSWITDVAKDFPHVSTVAVDLIPLQAAGMPQNLRSEVDDINLGLEHYFGDFNVVHARLISSGVRDYHRMIDQLAHVVRPGGLIDLAEFDFYIYDINHERIMFESDDEIRAPWWGQYMRFLREAVKAKGGDVNAATHLYDWVLKNPRFEQATYTEHWLPIVPAPYVGPDLEREEKIKMLMRSNHIAFLASGRPLLLGHGIPESLVTMLEQNAGREIDQRQTPQFTRLQCVTARRKSFAEPESFFF